MRGKGESDRKRVHSIRRQHDDTHGRQTTVFREITLLVGFRGPATHTPRDTRTGATLGLTSSSRSSTKGDGPNFSTSTAHSLALTALRVYHRLADSERAALAGCVSVATISPKDPSAELIRQEPRRPFLPHPRTLAGRSQVRSLSAPGQEAQRAREGVPQDETKTNGGACC